MEHNEIYWGCNASTPSFNPEVWNEEEYLTQQRNIEREDFPVLYEQFFPKPQGMYNAAAPSMIYISLREYLDLHFVLDWT